MGIQRTFKHQPSTALSERHRRNSELIVQSAQKCFESKGVRKTTLVDIAREANITRELIYYYFSGKQEIIDSLLDMYVQDAVETARLWCDECEQASGPKVVHGPNVTLRKDVPLTLEMLEDAVAALRRFVFVSDGSRRSMFDVLDEVDQRQEVFLRICSAVASELVSHPTVRRLAYTFGYDNDPMAEDMFKFVTLGIVGVFDTDEHYDNARIVKLLVRFAKRPIV